MTYSPIEWPTEFRAGELDFFLEKAYQTSVSEFTGAEQSILLSPGRWTASLKIGPLSKSEFRRFVGLLGRLSGPDGLVKYWDQSAETALGSAGGLSAITPKVFTADGVANTGKVLWTYGWGNVYSGLFKRGDYIGYAMSNGLYALHLIVGGYAILESKTFGTWLGAETEDVNSYARTINSADDGTPVTDNFAVLIVDPVIRFSPALDTALLWNDPPVVMRMADGQRVGGTVKSRNDGMVDISLVEFIPNYENA